MEELHSCCCDGGGDEPCCGSPAGPPADINERPGYTLCSYVDHFIQTPAGAVPGIKTSLDPVDRWGSFMARTTSARNDYRVSPGLYAVGDPDKFSRVLVSANYKLTFDHLRRQLGGHDLWLLILDTRGINVWCAGGKGTFGTDELVKRIEGCGLTDVVEHRKLILPQLGANGVAAHEVKKRSGFTVEWGPVRAEDLPRYLEDGIQDGMRRVRFNFFDRLILTPMELFNLRKPLLIGLPVMLLLGAVVAPALWLQRSLALLATLLLAAVLGAVVVPALLPFVPGRSFAFKGLVGGLLLGIGPVLGLDSSHVGRLGLLLMLLAICSFLAMNFTGSSTFTSPSGVEKEMRRYMPLQALLMLVGMLGWLAAGVL